MSKEIISTVQPSRRTLLKTVGTVGVAAAGGVLSREVFSPAIAAPAPKIRLAWTEVAACHSPLGFGVAKGFYAKHNLDVELFYQGASGQTLIQALATGKADAGAGLIGDWLKPLEQGFDVKLFVGSHGGCQLELAPAGRELRFAIPGGPFANSRKAVRTLCFAALRIRCAYGRWPPR